MREKYIFLAKTSVENKAASVCLYFLLKVLLKKMIIFCYSLTWCRSNWNIVCLLLLRTSNLVHFSKKGEIRKIELPDSIQPFFLASTNEQVAWCEKECRFKRKSDKWDFDQKHYLAVFIVRKTLLWKSFWLVNVWRPLVHKRLKL